MLSFEIKWYSAPEPVDLDPSSRVADSTSMIGYSKYCKATTLG